MKFKSVEISGFRAYDKSEDATFKFTTPEGEVLNFISLYAPNGFGKTSFYDAVEWGITNNVSRLWRRGKDTEKSINTLRELDTDKKQVNLLRNTNTSGPTFVRYFTDRDEKPVERLLKVHGSNKADTKKDVGEQLAFRDVILSQEWISAFLKEDDGEIRYSKFMKNHELQETDVYYQKIKVLQETNKKHLAELRENIKVLKSKISEEDEEDILETVNNLIQKINTDYQKPISDLITLSASKKEIKDLQDVLAKALIEEDNSTDLALLLMAIENAIVGKEGLFSKKQYFEARDNLRKLIAEIKAIEENLKQFERLEAAQNELESGNSEREALQGKAKILERLITQFDNYLETQKEIDDKHEEQKDLRKQKSKLDKEIEQVRRKQIDEKATLDSLAKNKVGLEKEQESLPKLKENLEKTATAIDQGEKRILDLEDIMDKHRADLEKIDEQISELELVKREAKEGQYALTSVSESPRLNKVVEDLLAKSQQKFTIKNELKQLAETITQQEELNTTIQGFIASGLDIVNRNETDSCPLCEHQYDSYKTLADKISNNRALSESLKILLEQKNRSLDEMAKIDTELEKLLNDLMLFYDNGLKNLKERRIQIDNSRTEDQKLLKAQESDLAKLKENQAGLINKTNGKSFENHTSALKESLKGILKNLEDTRTKLAKTDQELTNLETNEKEIIGRIELIATEIENLKSGKSFIEIENWFEDNNPGQKINKGFLEKQTKKNQSALDKVQELLAELRKEIQNLEENLKSLSQNNQQSKLSGAEDQKKDLEKKIAAYERFLQESLSIEGPELSDEALTRLLSQKENETKAQLKKTKKKLEDYRKLDKYSQNIVPFLERKNAKIELEKEEGELALVKKSVTPIINAEVKKTKEFLENKIKEFFYVELINEIYEKIDPHPEFKSVEFKANFDLGTPSLDVFVKDNNNQSTLIPNLYFSTAQINILSLSIFLASALNSHEYDCIFIDDPIQSMDSINVLSTIDLLRSIVINQEKQIILSTHDQNFHNLLKKKIPSRIFKSKFMELESFGKVKDDRQLTN
ncbi:MULTISPECIES: AAA family ATPase [Maribacter]|jgi:DNA repair protein SbcC/Rad50|uniref:AAA family ATPase n=2 Tax=Maribacter cobaltidurans TaxID=1178778 RepID=A0ABU7ITB2_9FLAO|nr:MULTISPECIES: AAA family ATPase [Maribacter]ASV32328.1 hypothetical protein CJ263_20025 [Maribacter cobaltidurans]MDC6388674.1 AAA family ATPase [Maribacter sp. PR1]MEE1976063.1 AAA family ATPase [Maribacter cobaltidurans]GGD94632.1 hypothetical protein GCM10011412_35820 [Maribacter cobaltidurans]